MVNKDEFSVAFEKYADAIFRHCYFRLTKRERALELTQDTFMKTWDYIQKGGQIKNIRAFLYTTLNRLIIDEYRKKKDISLDEILENEIIPDSINEALSHGSRSEKEKELENKQQIQHLKQSLKKLSNKDAKLIILRYINGLSARDTAKITGMKTTTVNVTAYRALQKLKTIMQQQIS